MVLSPNEYNALNKIASATKMDCWFTIETHDRQDFVYDLENDERLSIRDGVLQLFDGMVEPVEDEFYKLDAEEIIAFKNLLKRCQRDYMKQCKILDMENNEVHGGILTDNGDVICGCCGGLIEADEILTDKKKIGMDDRFTHCLLEVYDNWIDLSLEICGDNLYDDELFDEDEYKTDIL